MPRAKKKTFTKLDTTLYLFATISLLCIFLVKIFGGAEVSHLNMNIEKVKYSINEQSKKNESLTMKVNELTSFENILAVVKEMGLEYNNENILIINK
jgi:cell division protein FtsL